MTQMSPLTSTVTTMVFDINHTQGKPKTRLTWQRSRNPDLDPTTSRRSPKCLTSRKRCTLLPIPKATQWPSWGQPIDLLMDRIGMTCLTTDSTRIWLCILTKSYMLVPTLEIGGAYPYTCHQRTYSFGRKSDVKFFHPRLNIPVNF